MPYEPGSRPSGGGSNRDQHICLVYEDDPAEQLAALVPFVRDGLAANERCIWVVDDFAPETLRVELAGAGIEVAAHEASGALELWTRDDWRLPGELTSESKSGQIQAMLDEALSDGFKGLRVAVEMTWTTAPDLDTAALRHWEATLDEILGPDVPAKVACQYSRSRLKPEVLRAGLSTHPKVLIGAEEASNPFYEAPLVLRSPAACSPVDGERANWEVAQLLASHAIQREREQRLQAEARADAAEQGRERADSLWRIACQAAEDLREANRAKDDFLTLISHELRTPVTMIVGNAEILRSRGDTLDRESRAAAIADVHVQGLKLTELIGNLLVLARGSHTIDREPVLMGHLVESVVRDGSLADRIILHSDGREHMVLGNAGSLEEVLSNVLVNANKFSPGVEPIDVTVARVDGEVHVAVLDRGVGLEPDEMGQIFEPFYRSPRMASRVQGMGIGLSVCQRLLTIQGGRIWAEPRPGGGSVFTFAIPELDGVEPGVPRSSDVPLAAG